jgi:predicted transcriptional regulator
MNSKNLLSYLLYALIGLLLAAVGYKGCQVQKEKAQAALENQQLDQQLRDMGYVGGDSTGSAFVGADGTSAATYRDGAQESATTTGGGVAPATNSTATKGIEAEPATTSSTSTETDEEGKKVRVSDLDSEMGMRDKPKHMVITGSFRQLANARKSMEALVKKGYTDAEVGRFNRGTYACAIAKRTDDLNAANALAKKLKGLGFKDAFVKSKK